ncbi:MAG: histidinol dehydrogenase, partial [Bacteroidales bacterium]|nr:histidinol dehydrogenase [Bacteroidales bacterium]
TQEQLAVLPRRQTAEKALDNSISVLLGSLDECVEFSNCYAPEHLIIATESPMKLADKVINAGSVFLGEYSCESAGDYASGTNHTLPTKGFAKVSGGVSVDSFMKKITFQHLTAKGITTICGAIEKMAAAEGLDAHKNAVTIRLNSIRNKK